MYTRILEKDPQYKNLLITACCPGWCQTDMSNQSGTKTADEGAETPVWLALQPADSQLEPGFYTEKKKIDW
jgi:carbonyl reductase 1